MPRLATETYGTGDQSWLGSAHGIWNCRTVAPDPALFTAAAYPDGVPSGTPLGQATATGLFGPFANAATDGTGVLAGFLFTDQKAAADGGWPMLDHGRIRVDKLPVAFAAADGADSTGQFVFVDGSES